MSDQEREKILQRNNKIIQTIINEIDEECPGSVDLIAIEGSFCSNDYYEKSNLDLLIIRNNDSAKVLEKSFVYDGIGFNIRTQDWKTIESLSEYQSPFVTKLFSLIIVYFKNQEVINRIKRIQADLKKTMSNEEMVFERIRNRYSHVLGSFESLEKSDNLHDEYMWLYKIIKDIEYVIYFINKSYIKKSIRNIPNELLNMELLPSYFSEAYSDIVNCRNKEEIIQKASNLIGSVQMFLDAYVIPSEDKIVDKKMLKKEMISKDKLEGIYEGIFVNLKNNMSLASKKNDRYLSFMTIAKCQDIYDEMSVKYDIPHIDLISKYTPDDLNINSQLFDSAIEEMKKIYESFGVKLKVYNDLDELEGLYRD